MTEAAMTEAAMTEGAMTEGATASWGGWAVLPCRL